jgi:hypothetical protein
VKTAEDFWAANRLVADPMKMQKWNKLEETVLAFISWMNFGWDTQPQDPDFFTFDEGLVDLENFISKHDLIHDDYGSYKNFILKEFLPQWGLWADKTIHDPIWGTVEGFWKNSEIFQALCQESPATEIYARYGIQTALPAFAVRQFKSRLESHKRSREGVGRSAHVQYDGEKCWLCQFERLHEETQ